MLEDSGNIKACDCACIKLFRRVGFQLLPPPFLLYGGFPMWVM